MPDQVDWRAMERETTSGRAVGRLLRDQREARGLSVVDVETSLRIRKAYIEALEAGRFDLLPGAAYIPAFLRAYALHVGLEPEKVLTAYQLSGAVPIKRPVALPADFPVVEKRAPIGLAVLTVLLVIGAGYGVWRYLPRQQTVISEKVPPVPDRLLASRPAPPPTQAKPSTSEVTQVAVPVTVPSQEKRVTPPVSTTASRQEPATPPTPPVIVTVPAPPPVVMSVPSIGQAQAAQPAIVEAPRADVQQATAPAASAPPSAPAADAAAAMQTATQVDTAVRVRSNSWVELRSPNGDVLAQTYVRAGESYTVPAGISYRVIDAR
ncbi:MAG: helix-turn-helix domain-containing protein [Proteobacteria bacterium]|nr:helix-turn-helix domain-containing protein [Pseudomonadota bacterium]